MQGQALTHFLQHIRRFELGGGERWDESRGGKAGEGADVVGVPSGAVSPFAVAGVMVGLLGVDAAVGAGFEVEDAGADVGVLAGADFAFAVEIPDRFREGFEDVGPGLVQDVPDVVGGDDVGFAAFDSAGEAEEADEVGVVGVEELSGGWLVLFGMGVSSGSLSKVSNMVQWLGVGEVDLPRICPINPDLVDLSRIFP